MRSEMQAAVAAVRAYALGLPGAREDHPWGESVAKVGAKVFVFLGKDRDSEWGCSVKLPRSATAVLDRPFAEPTGYGLGRSGWVTLSFREEERVPVEQLKGWIEESYRAVAPKKLVKELDGRQPGAAAAPAKSSAVERPAPKGKRKTSLPKRSAPKRPESAAMGKAKSKKAPLKKAPGKKE